MNVPTYFIALSLVAASLLASGCSITRVAYADRHIETYLPTIAKQVDRPLARELSWKFSYTYGQGSYQQAWLIADGKKITNAKDAQGIAWYAARPVTGGFSTAAMHDSLARDASRRGDYQMARIRHSASEASMQAQQQAERLSTVMELGQAMANLASALLDNTIILHAEGAAKYVKSPDRGVIGDGAPEGTRLELFFQCAQLDGKDAKPAGTINTRWETVATLVDATGKVWRSAASFTTYQAFERDAHRLAGLDPDTHVRLAQNSLIPVGRVNAGQEEAEIYKVLERRGAGELGITAMQAIADLYAQIDAAREQRTAAH